MRFLEIMIFAGFVSSAALAADPRPAQPAQVQDEAPFSRHPDWNYREMDLLPVQSGGRIKPFDSLARELTLFETGSTSFEGWDPVEMVISWVSFPKYWSEHAFLQISRVDVKRELGLEEGRSKFSPKELFSNSTLLQYAKDTPQETPKGMKANPRDEELKRVLSRMSLFGELVSGAGWTVIPRPAPEAWETLTGDQSIGQSIRHIFLDLFRSYRSGDRARFEEAEKALRAEVEGSIPQWTDSQKRVVSAESFYNHLRPYRWAWILYFLAGLLWALSSQGEKGKAFAKTSARAAGGIAALAFLTHCLGIGIRCYIAGRPPVTNMYESIMWVSLGVVVFAGILLVMTKQSVPLMVACFLAAFGLIAGDSAPAMMDPGIHPLVPVLRSNYWLTIHVLTITMGYAAFALTLGIANLTLFQFFRQAQGGAGAQGATARIALLNQLTYRAMQFGVVLLAAGTILGGIWADYSWGRFWGWDPKETWALIALLSYLVILHGRFAGWVGQFGYAAWSVFAFLSVVMAWYGVNFVLGVGLHSYGFSSGGLGWVCGFVGLQLAYVGAVALFRMQRMGGTHGVPRSV